jgi:hypothetical protein
MKPPVFLVFSTLLLLQGKYVLSHLHSFLCFLLVDWTLEQNAKIGSAGNLVDTFCGRVAEGKYGDKIRVAVVRGEERLALYAQGAKMCHDVGGFHDFVQRVGVALAVKVYAVFVADGVELAHGEKLGERLVFVRGGQVRGDDLISARPVSSSFHFVNLLFFLVFSTPIYLPAQRHLSRCAGIFYSTSRWTISQL